MHLLDANILLYAHDSTSRHHRKVVAALGVQFWSADKDFSRFAKLRWRNPLSAKPGTVS